ncbi:hypothetical protein [Brevundimonas naejangsanensis]|uniref:hypothetical protein n=1 Tax=Brevundimonas naejangsanensis TaxID=588932 RepID=UPI003D0257FF
MSNEQLLGIAVFALAVFALLSGIVVGRLLNDVRRLRVDVAALNPTKATASSVSHLPATVSNGLFSPAEREKLRNLMSATK